MCQIILFRLGQDLDEDEINNIQLFGEDLGFRLMISKNYIELDGYKNDCFCTPQPGWREALIQFTERILGKNYYVYFRHSDLYIEPKPMPLEHSDRIRDTYLDILNDLDKLAERNHEEHIDDKEFENLKNDIEEYLNAKRNYDVDLNTIDF